MGYGIRAPRLLPGEHLRLFDNNADTPEKLYAEEGSHVRLALISTLILLGARTHIIFNRVGPQLTADTRVLLGVRDNPPFQ